MNTQSNAVPDSSVVAPEIKPAAVPATRLFLWSVRRELWENRAVYIAPVIAAIVFLFGFFINIINLRRHLSISPLDPAQQHDLLFTRYEIAAALIMTTAFLVGIFYTLDALYGERRDRSILFWKSLPVSDLIVVLSKVTIPAVILPFVSLVISIAAQLIMLVLSSAVFAGSGVDVAKLWSEASFFHVSAVMLYHIITVHGLWYAPIYGWLLLISAWAPRAPFLWAFLPPFVIGGVEKLAFNTTHFLTMLQHRLEGPPHPNSMSMGLTPMDPMAFLIPAHFFSEPGLWVGLAMAVVFLFAAVRLRRYHGPI
jgi:ABC-2 type transport system permease protein